MGVSLTTSGPGTANIRNGLAALNGSDVLVGIPEDHNNRAGRLLDQAANIPLTKTGKTSKRALRLARAANRSPIGNAPLLFIFTNGSPIRRQPPRPVIEPAIAQPNTKAMIAKQLANAANAALDGDHAGMVRYLDRAGTIGESASKQWFTNPANNWPPNSPRTIAMKGSDTPGIDIGEMWRAITHVVEAAPLGSAPKDEAKATTLKHGGTVETKAEASQSGTRPRDNYDFDEAEDLVFGAADEIATGAEALAADVAEGAEVIL
jgi:hypothetical protein